MRFEIAGWQIIQFINYDDEEWSYEHIYRHADGREAVVGPGGYCSDPDLSWLLHRRRSKKKQMARIARHFDLPKCCLADCWDLGASAMLYFWVDCTVVNIPIRVPPLQRFPQLEFFDSC